MVWNDRMHASCCIMLLKIQTKFRNDLWQLRAHAYYVCACAAQSTRARALQTSNCKVCRDINPSSSAGAFISSTEADASVSQVRASSGRRRALKEPAWERYAHSSSGRWKTRCYIVYIYQSHLYTRVLFMFPWHRTMEEVQVVRQESTLGTSCPAVQQPPSALPLTTDRRRSSVTW